MSLGTRSFSNVPLRALQQRLSKSGFESVQPELKLMREEISVRRASSDVPSERNEMEWELGELEKMVQRRLKGEPLQYILGGYPWAFPPLFLDRGSVITDLKHRLHLHRESTVWSNSNQDSCADPNSASRDRRLDDSLDVFAGGPILDQGRRRGKDRSDA